MTPIKTFLDNPSPIAFAHRGGSVKTENCLAGFEAAEQLGLRYIETDVRTTRDGVPMVFHDQDLQRMTGFSGTMDQMDSDDVARLTLPGGEKIPTLEETLETFPEMRFNLDLKDDAAVEPVVRMLERMDAKLQVCLTSFSERRVDAVRRALGPEVCTGLGVTGVLRGVFNKFLPWCEHDWTRGAAVVQIPLRIRGVPVVTPHMVERAQEAGLAVHVWTLNNRSTIERALDLRVDGVMTDKPKLLKEILVARGLWGSRGSNRDAL